MSPPLPLPPSPALARDFDDFDELAEVLSGWDLDFRQLGRGPFQGRVEQLAGRHALLARGEVGRALEQRGDPPAGAWTFVVPARGCSPCTWRGKLLGSGDIGVIRSGEELDLLHHGGYSVFSFSVFEEHLAAVCEAQAVPLAQLFGDDGVRRGPEARLEALRRALGEALRRSRDTTLPEQVSAAGSMLDMQATHELVACLSPEDHLDHSPTRSRQRVFGAARALANASEEPLTVEQLCRLVATNQRTLHRAFHENCGVSPKAYLKASRLNQVRKLLRRGSSATVSSAANRFDFWHMGQLAADYHQQFGELPSGTLARARMGPMRSKTEPAD